MRTQLCSRVISLMENGRSGPEAARLALEYMLRRVGSRGGLVGVDRAGAPFHVASTARMAWASVQADTAGGAQTVASGCDNHDVFPLDAPAAA
jgi:isoaspartyl peptidase/L-asparaginase-like protein (Ntn-hydrolase superfamily)